jgi:hypothetical protein
MGSRSLFLEPALIFPYQFDLIEEFCHINY